MSGLSTDSVGARELEAVPMPLMFLSILPKLPQVVVSAVSFQLEGSCTKARLAGGGGSHSPLLAEIYKGPCDMLGVSLYLEE